MESNGSEDGGFASKRNKAILFALSKRLSFDPNKFPSESIGNYDIMSLFSNVLQSSAGQFSMQNHDEILKWVSFASNFPSETDACHGALKALNDDLTHKAVLLGNGFKPSEADIVVFSALHSFVIHHSNMAMENFPHVMRWMDYIQNKEDFGGALEMIAINKPEFEFIRKAAAGDKAPEVSKNDNKTSEGKKKAPEKGSSEKDAECSISILNIQVGLIRKAWKHPSADSLLVEEIDLGDGNLRQVVSGLAKYCSPDELLNRHVVLITNVKPGKLRDVMSAGLVLCASNQDHTVVEPLIPPEGAILGEQVSFSGHDGKPEEVLNPKKKQLDKITPHLYTDENGVATYKGIPFMTSAGPCTSSISNASIK